MKLPGWAHEPILHFLLVGFVVFTANEWLNPETSVDGRVISIDRESLTRFIQFRTQAFSENANKRLDSLSQDALSDLIDQYIREEALYRKALSYGMDTQDYVIKRRLVQKMEFLAEGTAPASESHSTEALRSYYEANSDKYEIPAAVTFTHVFFSSDRNGSEVVRIAEETLELLNRDQIRFDQAPGFGERFPYQLNYVERTQEEVAGHFGTPAANVLFQLKPDKQEWQGPIQSAFGNHLVLLTDRQPARVPPLEEIIEQVASELQSSLERERKDAVIKELVAEFEVDISPEFTVVLKE